MTEKFTYDVFISYSSQDKALVHPLAERLRCDGVEVWLDVWAIEPGDPIGIKIQQGIDNARVLLMCMSKAYFASEWAKLEHHSLLFRDPTNEQRRFIPVFIEDCERPGVLAQFSHVDWRQQEESAYQKLLAICTTPKAQGEPVTDSEEEAREAATTDHSIATLEGHTHDVNGVAISPDGKRALSGSDDTTLKLWDLDQESLIATLEGHTGAVLGVAISPDGKRALSGSDDTTLKLWDLDQESLIATLEGHTETVFGVAISPDGKRGLSGSNDTTLKLWDLDQQSLIATLEGHTGQVYGVAISPDGRRALSGSDDNTLKIWDLDQQGLITTLEGHTDEVNDVVISPDGKRALSCSDDKTLKLWDLDQQSLIATLEGHTAMIWRVAISLDGKRAISGSSDNTLKLWDLDQQSLIATLEGHTESVFGVAISADGKRALSGSYDHTLKLWDIPALDRAYPPTDTARYTNAKVVLVGESGAGKSGLALRLADDKWHETGSTHGMSVTKLDLPNELAGPVEREVWLWDFAGQPDYRLIHQLYMDETALALMVVDPQKDEPFLPLGHWEQALSRAVKHDPEKLLVAARCDRGGHMISKRDIGAYVASRGYAAQVDTAAKSKDHPGCAKLKKLIAEHIPWDRLPSTSTTVLFKALKDAVIEIKESGIVLIRVVELEQRLRLGWDGEPFEERDLRTVIGLLAGQGLIQALAFGDFVLLQPEQINNYGSAVVRAARNSETELAELSEQEVMEAKIDFQDMKRLKEDDEEILLRAMLQTFFDRSLCLSVNTPEGVKLVFPAYFKQNRPEIPERPQIKVTYRFAGPVDEIYTTLIVRLHYSNEFKSERLWRYAADFKSFCEGRVGLLLTKE